MLGPAGQDGVGPSIELRTRRLVGSLPIWARLARLCGIMASTSVLLAGLDGVEGNRKSMIGNFVRRVAGYTLGAAITGLILGVLARWLLGWDFWTTCLVVFALTELPSVTLAWRESKADVAIDRAVRHLASQESAVTAHRWLRLPSGWPVQFERQMTGRVTWSYPPDVPQFVQSGESWRASLELTKEQVLNGESDLWFPELKEKAERELHLMDTTRDEQGREIRVIPSGHSYAVFIRDLEGKVTVERLDKPGASPTWGFSLPRRLSVLQLQKGEQLWYPELLAEAELEVSRIAERTERYPV